MLPKSKEKKKKNERGMGSSKRGADNNRRLSGRTQTAHQRLHDALNLGTRSAALLWLLLLIFLSLF